MRASTRPPLGAAIGAWLQSPVTQTNALQMLKAVAAAVVAWTVAAPLLGLQQAFLAPWVALLTVHATVYRTVWRGFQTVLSVGAGIVLSFVVVLTLGTTAWSLGVALLVGLMLARLKVLRDEGVTIATTALFVITSGYESSSTRTIDLLPDRLFATAIGVVVALLVNLIIVPPLADRSAREQIDDVDRDLGALLGDMAQQLRRPWESQGEDDWIERTRSIDTKLNRAWTLVRSAQESGTWNPRRRRHPDTAIQSYPQVLTRLEEGVSHLRSIARHLRESGRNAQEWDPRFRDSFIDLLAETGRRVADADSDVAELRESVLGLAVSLSGEDLPGLLWTLYGALIANLLSIIDVVDDVATSDSVRT